MKYYIYFFLISIVSISSHAFNPNQEAAIGLFGARGYVVNQQAKIKKIDSLYPELATDVKLAQMEFDLAYPNAIESIEIKAKQIFGDVVLQGFATTDLEVKNHFEKLTITKDEAIAFIKLVQNRASGNIERDNVKKFLNAVIFFDEPHREFKKNVVNYDFSGNDKSKGLDVIVQMPLSWQPVDSNLPNTIKGWRSEVGTGSGYNSIDIRKFEGQYITEKNILDSVKMGIVPRGMAQKENIKSSIQFVKLSRLPGVIFNTETTGKRLDYEFIVVATQLILYDNDKTISLNCGVFDKLESQSLARATMSRFSSLCQAFFNSIVVKNKF